MIKAVIFDLDGLMIDSEQLSHRSLNLLLSRFGCHISAEEYRHMIGLDNLQFARYALDRFGLNLSPEQLMEEHHRQLQALMQTELQPAEGLLPLLRRLKVTGLKLAVASNSPISYVENALQIIGVRQDFDCLLGEDLVARPKPAPDVYLAAAEGVGAAPAECLALEDSPVGLRAALAAGIPCVVIPNAYQPESDFSGALARFESLSAFCAELDSILDRFNHRRAELA